MEELKENEKNEIENEKVKSQVAQLFLFEVFKVIISFFVQLVLKSWWDNSYFKTKWNNWRKKNEKK